MEVELVLALAAAGTMLGVVEGLKPGPLMTMVVRETLSGGLKAGVWTAAAPIFTDGPLILISLVAAASIANNPMVLLVITVAGALFLAKMGIDCFTLDAPEFNEEPGAPSGSLFRGVVTNLLNPNAYVFWFLIGGPLMASVVQEEWLAPVAYALSFLLTLMLTKAGVAYAVHKASNGISETVYKRLLAGCGVVMLGFSAFYVRAAWQLLN
ncbi:MAG: LysE family translocator [Candidatus Poseidoniaceae archaeon]|nr:LysE family translocator [Candidatus Poseidoniaceae archaeon]